MKHLLVTTIAAVVLVGCATTQSPEPPTAKAPDISFHGAAMMGMIELVKQHIASGTDVNAKDDSGSTPLHRAALNGRKETVELLIANGAEVNAKDNLGWTPLDFAIIRNHTETADLLRKHGGKTSEELKAEGK
jgi:ankyrin repeat protein